MTVTVAKLSPTEEIPELASKVIDGVKELGIAANIYQVESDYYNWSLEERQQRLGAPSTENLCKTLLFENTRIKLLEDQSDLLDKRHPKYVLVLIQYVDKMSTKKLNVKMKEKLLEITGIQQSSKVWNMRIAPEEIAQTLTGYSAGGVTPIGLAKKSLRIVVCERASKLSRLYLGAGHADWKVAIDTKEFIEKSNALVWDLSE